jgi:RNA polymerase sigma-70 factor (ECF subfamily)
VSAVAPVSSGHAPQALPAAAAGLLYERYSRRIFGYCLSLLGSREDAEDAVQTTFINAQRGLHRGVTPQFELAWLFKIARNVCYNAHESSSRRGRVESVRDLDALQDVLATPERGLGVSIAELTRALGAVPERQRRALLLREFQGLSYDEIAAQLNVSVAAVETLIFRARRSVAEQLEQTGTTSRRGVLAALIAFLRRPFGGAAAPVKLAAVGAAVATTATLAVVPALRDRGPVPAPASPGVRGLPAQPGIDNAAVPPVLRGRAAAPTKGRAPVVSPAVPTAASPAETLSSSAPAQNAGQAAPPSTPSPTQSDVGAVITSPAVTTPSVTLAGVTVPGVTVPATDLTVPEISLPEVDVPAVELPAVVLPAVPELPKLP